MGNDQKEFPDFKSVQGIGCSAEDNFPTLIYLDFCQLGWK
jgi:hypothetical protein